MALNPFVSLIGRLVARSGRKRGNRQTDRQTDRQNDKTTPVILAALGRTQLEDMKARLAEKQRWCRCGEKQNRRKSVYKDSRAEWTAARI